MRKCWKGRSLGLLCCHIAAAAAIEIVGPSVARSATDDHWIDTSATGSKWDYWSTATGNYPSWQSGQKPADTDNVYLDAPGGIATSVYDIGPLYGYSKGMSLSYLEVDQVGAPSAPLSYGMVQRDVLTVGTVKVGQTAPGTYGSGGGLTVTDTLYLGSGSGISGSFDLALGGLACPTEDVGEAGTGTFNQAASTNAVSSILFVGHGATGNYNLNGGTITAPHEIIGYGGTGNFNQFGGVNNPVVLEVGAFTSGTYVTSSPNGVNTNQIQIGSQAGGYGTFVQLAGTVNVTAASGQDGSIYVGAYAKAGSPNAYNLGGGTLNAVDLLVGANAMGDFDQSGGAANLSGNLRLGNSAPTGSFTATYELAGNNSSIAAANEYIGVVNGGAFTQSDSSTNTITGALVIGQQTGSAGPNSSYELLNGTIVAGSETVGGVATGNFGQDNGTNQCAGSLTLAGVASSYHLGGGTLLVGGNETLQDGPNAAQPTSFDQYGGSHTVSGTLTIGVNGSGYAEFKMEQGSLTAGNLSINSATLFQSGGNVTVPGTLTITSTVINGVPHNGLYSLDAGSLTSSIANLTQPESVLRVGGQGLAHLVVLQGSGTMQVDAAGQALFDTPEAPNEIDAVVNNAGTVALVAGSDVQFPGTINNNAGGTLDLRIDAGLNGSGTLNVNAGSTFQKSGGGGTSAVSGLTLTNAGTIDGQTGTLDLNVTGTNAGPINSEANATVKLGGQWTLNGGSFNGTGVTNLYGTAYLMASVTASTQFQIAAGGSLQGSGYTFTSSNELDLQDGSGASSPTSTPLTITSQGTMNVTGSPSLNGVVLNAQGPTNQAGGGNPYATLNCGSNTAINNSGTWTVADDSGIDGDASTSAFNNSGNFLKTAGAATTSIGIPFNNTGTINAESGTIDFPSGGGGNGTFVAATGAALTLGGNWALGDGAHFTGGGWTTAYGTITQTGNATTDGNFALTGTLQGTGVLTNSGYMNLTGTVSGATLANAAGGQLWINGSGIVAGGKLVNAGTTTIIAAGYGTAVNDGSSIDNSGTFVIEGGTGIVCYGSPVGVFTNEAGGLLGSGQGNGSTATIAMYIENQGTINASGAGVQLVLSGGHGAAGSVFRAMGDGVLVLDGSGSSGWTFDAGTIFDGNGVVETANTSYTINGTVTNNGHFLLAGNTTLSGPGQFDNAAQFDLSGNVGQGLTLHNVAPGTISVIGSPTLYGTLTNDARGVVLFPADNSYLSMPGSTLTNNGMINFAADGGIGGSYPPSGNQLINNGQIEKTGGSSSLIDVPLQNSTGAVINANGYTFRLTGGGSNNGTFQGGAFVLQGTWTLGDSSLTSDASLIVSGPTTVAGTVQATNGTITVYDNLYLNGTIYNQSLVNNGAVWHKGAIIGGGVTNNYNYYLSGGIMQCGVLNNGWFEVSGGDQTIDGSFDNEGTLKLDQSNLNVTMGMINNGTIISDPADSHYSEMTVTAKGALVGGKGDRFFISGDFRSQSNNAKVWNTAAAQLLFTGGTVHIFDVNGKDLGPTGAAYKDNFAWGTLSLAEGEKLFVINESGTSEAGLYLQMLDLPDGVDQISMIESDGVNIYYDPTQPGDSYLDGRTFTLTGGGLLMPDPYDPAAIPGSFASREFASPTAPFVSTTAVPLPPQVLPALAVIAVAGGFLARTRRRRAASVR